MGPFTSALPNAATSLASKSSRHSAAARGFTLGLILLLSGCAKSPTSHSPPARPLNTRLLALGSGLTAALPARFHEVPSLRGRAFRLRNANKPSFATLSLQYRLSGQPARLDNALEQVVSELKQLGNFDLVDLQLHYIGRHLALSYTMLFDQLEVAHRQWGVLVSTPDGLVGLLMTAPLDGFVVAGPDFLDLIDSLVDESRS